MKEKAIPMVLLDQVSDSFASDYVTSENYLGGFLNALKDAKLPAYPELYSYDLNGQMDGKEQMRRLFLFL